MPKKKTIRELYFYKKPGTDLYAVDIVDGRNEHIHKALNNLTRLDVSNILEQIGKNKHSKYTESKNGMKVFNKIPENRILSFTSEKIVNAYMDHLKELQESDESRVLAARLLHAAADLLAHDVDCNPPDRISNVPYDDGADIACEPCDLMPVPDEACKYPELENPGIIPSQAVNCTVSYEVMNYVQEKLDVTIDLENLTFWFNDQKWQLQKDVDEHVSSTPKRPKSSPVIMNSMDFMSNLLGVDAEKSVDIDYLYFRFPLLGNMYKISHVYTGDRVAPDQVNENFSSYEHFVLLSKTDKMLDDVVAMARKDQRLSARKLDDLMKMIDKQRAKVKK